MRRFIALAPEAIWGTIADLGRLPHWQPFVASIVAPENVAVGAEVDWVPAMSGDWVHRRLAPPARIHDEP